MGETFVKLLERVSLYEILNNIVPGAAFIALMEHFTTFHLFTEKVAVDIVLCYFVGLTIGRIGSVVVGELLSRFEKYRKLTAPYADYLTAEKADSRIRDLAMINNMYRTFAAVSLCLLCAILLDKLMPALCSLGIWKPLAPIIGCILLVVVYLKAYVKQTKAVADRVNIVIENEKAGKNKNSE